MSSRGRANGIASVGDLVAVAPKKQAPDHYTYDPAAAQIPKELKNVKNFGDLLAAASTVVKIDPSDNAVLLYRTSPLSEPLEIGGPIDLDLYFSTSGFARKVSYRPDFSVQPLCPLCLCGCFPEQFTNHKDTEDTEVAQRRSLIRTFRAKSLPVQKTLISLPAW
jgi:hypothetical protein